MRSVSPISILLALALAACTPAEDGAAMGAAASETEPADDSADGSAPDSFVETAWRAVAADGARYTTMFDADGTYRDLRNGEPWQEGSWTFAEGPEGKQLCFTPAAENSVEGCWMPGTMEGDAMFATGAEGKRIELTSAEYEPPASGESEAVE